MTKTSVSFRETQKTLESYCSRSVLESFAVSFMAPTSDNYFQLSQSGSFFYSTMVCVTSQSLNLLSPPQVSRYGQNSQMKVTEPACPNTLCKTSSFLQFQNTKQQSSPPNAITSLFTSYSYRIGQVPLYSLQCSSFSKFSRDQIRAVPSQDALAIKFSSLMKITFEIWDLWPLNAVRKVSLRVSQTPISDSSSHSGIVMKNRWLATTDETISQCGLMNLQFSNLTPLILYIQSFELLVPTQRLSPKIQRQLQVFCDLSILIERLRDSLGILILSSASTVEFKRARLLSSSFSTEFET